MSDSVFFAALLGMGALLLALVWLTASARAACAGLGRDLEAMRAERDAHRDRCGALEGEAREARDAHGAARGDVSRLEQTERHLREVVERLERDAGGLEATLEAARGEVKRLEVANGRLEADLAARRRAHDEEVALLKEIRDDMANRFKTLADATLREHGDRFGALNQERMAALLKPMREQVDHFQRELREAHTGAAKDRERLKSEIDQLTRRSEEVSREAVALTNALKGEKQRQGAWGEMILERLLEDSGLEKGREYETQFSVTDADGGRRRPDVVVRLPGDKAVVIDAKVSLVAYEAAVNAEGEEERARQMRAHLAATRAHIDELARRDYAALVSGSVDYVLMFMPVEGALAAALAEQPDLTAYAMSRRVGIATPTTLMMALRTIQHVWAVETRQRNAEDIARRAGLLHDKMAGVVEAFEKVGDHLGRAQSEHATALERLSRGNGNVLGQFDKLRRLGARTGKTLAKDFDPEDDEGEDAPLALAPEPAE
ncbi:DNA recombination protein RmuC [Jannaschia sp. W003]|uniref:DNA recombination protein RmuC n=1 Tax=Jannaschia sp. W003 TaxID=2867012 RepID=UPI0021A53AA2|nr:DNA recombination protein RmuC [Jannaschia sp. W003]UWQ20021.1 DNA recombination protein RmuC [Jannaschia sp. W003]